MDRLIPVKEDLHHEHEPDVEGVDQHKDLEGAHCGFLGVKKKGVWCWRTRVES